MNTLTHTLSAIRLFFSILSLGYISGIFLLADSSVVYDLSSFNPYSLLHIPLYGILTILLIFSFVPLTQLPHNLMTPIHPSAHLRINPLTYFLIPASIALIVAIADEIHQAYIAGRDASIIDVLLDMFGILLAVFLIRLAIKSKASNVKS